MAEKKKITSLDRDGPVRLPNSAEAMENECIALAYELTMKRLIEGTASAQETVHFLKMGSQREKHEREKLEEEIEVLKKKAEAYDTAKRIEALYSDAIGAVTSYKSSVRADSVIDD